MTTQHLPIGIFDSGVGGLTVLKAIHETLPHENLLYLGDTARLPYGTKSPETVANYALQATKKLVEKGIKMLVIACNTATAAALPTLTKAFAPLPVIGVIEPGAEAAIENTRNGHIAVLATEGTIKGMAYRKAIHAQKPDLRITEQACTLFVPLAEEGWMDGPLVEGIIARYIAHIFPQTAPATSSEVSLPDTLLLGCTHFPPLRHAIANVVGKNICIVDSAATTAVAVQKALQSHGLFNGNTQGHCHFMTTDDKDRFARAGSLFLGKTLYTNDVEHLDL